MLKMFDYECVNCGTFEALVFGNAKRADCPSCGLISPKIMSAPMIHTLETSMRGYRDSDGKWSPCEGSFTDINLCDRDGRPQTYSSPREKQRLLDKHGLYEKAPKKKKPQYFTGGSRRG